MGDVRFLKQRQHGSIRSYLLQFLVCVNVAIIVLLSVGAYTFYQDSFIQEIATARVDVSRQIAERTRQFKTSIYTLSNLYCSNGDFLKAADTLTQQSLPEFTAFMDDLTAQLDHSFESLDLEFYVVYYSQDGLGYCSRPVPEDYDYMNPTVRLWYRDIHKAPGQIVDVAGYKDTDLGMRVFSAARSVHNAQGDVVGYLMVNADERQMYQMYSDVITNIRSQIYVTNDRGQIVSSSLEKIVGFSYFSMENLEQLFDGEQYMIADIAGDKALFTRYYDPESQFTVFEEISLSELTKPLKDVRDTTILLSICVLALAMWLVQHVSQKVTAPIEALYRGVQQVEHGQLDYQFQENSYREIHALSQGMNNMLGQIRALIRSVQREEQLKKQMEINWLQAQINPHFMYNTLFSIRCMVEMGNNQEAVHMLSLFIQLLRGVLSTNQEVVTVRSQIEWLREYVELQKIRYDHAFDTLIEYDPMAAECYIPKLLIQPLVENSIQHAIDMDNQDGIISVIVRRVDDAILINVEDNGCGMTQEHIQQIMTNPKGKDRPHIGIKNIHDRIRLYYGEPWGVEIESIVGVGTRIELRVPAMETPPAEQEATC